MVTDTLAKSTGVSAAIISRGVRNDAEVSLSTPHRTASETPPGGGLLTLQPPLAGGRGTGLSSLLVSKAQTPIFA